MPCTHGAAVWLLVAEVVVLPDADAAEPDAAAAAPAEAEEEEEGAAAAAEGEEAAEPKPKKARSGPPQAQGLAALAQLATSSPGTLATLRRGTDEEQ